MILGNKNIFELTKDNSVIEKIKSLTKIKDLTIDFYDQCDQIVRLNHIAILANITENKQLLENVENDIKEYEQFVSERSDFGEIID